MTDKVIALDVGGTMIKGAVVAGELTADSDGGIKYHRWATPRADGPDAVVARVLTVLDELLERAGDAAAVGLVVPGVVDDAAGIARYSENIGWHDVPFRQLVGERCGRPVGFGHDVRTGGLAERLLGAGRDARDLLFLPIGTGISGAMFIDGRMVTDAYSGEIGHIDVGADVDCVCGAHGCLEAVASAASIARRYHQASGIAVPGAREVVDRLGDDPIARRVWGDAVAALARALATYVSLLAPERIVIGGGLACAGQALFDPLRNRLRELLVWQPVPQLVPARLGDNAACLGAAILARRASAATRTTASTNEPSQQRMAP
ncbi:MAG: ROK family protein [Actinomycetia bacterium]|nr:ROK family protein [Actinomycetes bacterium]